MSTTKISQLPVGDFFIYDDEVFVNQGVRLNSKGEKFATAWSINERPYKASAETLKSKGYIARKEWAFSLDEVVIPL